MTPQELAAAFPPGRWHGSWIWADGPFPQGARPGAPTDAGTESWVMFRRAVDVDRVADVVPCRISADSRYVLWCNGDEVARGPVRGHPRLMRYDVVDLAPHLRPGPNVLAALVRHYGEATSWSMPLRPRTAFRDGVFVLEAVVDAERGELLVTDGDWRSHVPDAWQVVPRLFLGAPVPDEVVDLGRIPPGWRERSFDDGGWDHATVLTPVHRGHHDRSTPPADPYGPMLASPLRQRRGDVVRPVSATVRPAAELGRDVSAVEPSRQVVEDEATLAASAAGLPFTESDGADGGATGSPMPITLEAGVTAIGLDFGRIVAGEIVVDVEGPAGATVDLAVSERRAPDGSLVTTNQRSGMRLVLRGHDDAHARFDPTGLRHATVVVRASAPATVRDVHVRELLAPRRDGARFACSDPALERIFAIGRRTVDLCSTDAYVDCPTREGRAWTGDATVHQLVDLTTNLDWSLARHHPRITAVPRPDGMVPMSVAGDIEHADMIAIPDWPLHWVRSLWNLWWYVGDGEEVASLLPVAEGVLRWFTPFQQRDGLLHDVTGWVLIDWSSVSLAGAPGALSALWADALGRFAELADAVGDAGRARWARAHRDDVAAGMEQLWDEQRRVYVDNLLRSPDGSSVRGRAVSQHTNAAALVASIVPEDRRRDVALAIGDRERLVRASWTHSPDEFDDGETHFTRTAMSMPAPWWDLDRQIVAAQPFYRYVVHEALAASLGSGVIPDLCRDWSPFVEAGETTWPETWFGGSRCHAWCSTPTHDLVVHTLGVRPGEPGFGRARVAPALGDLEWASGTAATPAGWIDVHATSGGELVVDTPIPADVEWGGQRRSVDPGRSTIPGAA